MLGLTNFVRPNISKKKNPASIYGQDMRLLMAETHMHLYLWIYSPVWHVVSVA